MDVGNYWRFSLAAPYCQWNGCKSSSRLTQPSLYGCVLSASLMSLFDLCVWVCVISIPYVIVWSVCMGVWVSVINYPHSLYYCLICVCGHVLWFLISFIDLSVWLSLVACLMSWVHVYVSVCYQQSLFDLCVWVSVISIPYVIFDLCMYWCVTSSHCLITSPCHCLISVTVWVCVMCYQHSWLCVYGVVLSAVLSLFDLSVWVCVISIPYVIVWSVCFFCLFFLLNIFTQDYPLGWVPLQMRGPARNIAQNIQK